MARIERKVAGLIMRDAGIVESIRIVLEKSEDGKVELDWADVRGEITSGHWGRLIETGILKEGKKGFQVSDAFTIKQAIENFDKPRSKKSKISVGCFPRCFLNVFLTNGGESGGTEYCA